jgi:ATP-dependent RNA helicase DeaD
VYTPAPFPLSAPANFEVSLPASSDQTPGESPTFSDLALGDAVLKALLDVGYESPSPIQAATIPHLLGGRDVVGQAQTGTGKTAAFALPILSKIDTRETLPQALVLVPTRELAIQVAEAFQKYATYMKGFHVLPVYGGQSYTPQLQSLRRGVQVVVATPGRAMDHIKRGTLDLSSLKHLVLDEADEMLRMGFIDDVEWILEQIPAERQIALFSATMPAQVRRIAQQHLREPAEVTIKSKTTTASKIRQRYWVVSGMHKLDALTRILEAEAFDAMLVFARTKIATEDLAQRLSARGFSVEALNGDIAQQQRERTIARLKSGQIDIVVATDVAARGLDVERVSHVVNYDVPYDPESYVHRIGRTGRAGRSGEAILFIAPRERNMLRVIERATRQIVEQMQMPTIEDVNERRVAKFNEKLAQAIAANAGQAFMPLIESYERDNNVPALEIAAALASIAQGATPLLLEPQQPRSNREAWSSGESSDSGERAPRRERAPRPDREARNDKYAKRERDLRTREQEGEGSAQPARAAWPSSEGTENAGARSERASRSSSEGADSTGARSERAPRSSWGEGSDVGARQDRAPRAEWKPREEGASRERASGSDWARREERPSRERDARSAWKPREEGASQQRKARPDAETESGGRSGLNEWQEETVDSSYVADFWKTSRDQAPRDPEAQSEQTPKLLNRRERRAIERAERERLAAGGEGAEIANQGEGGESNQSSEAAQSSERAEVREGDQPRERAEIRDSEEGAQRRERAESGDSEIDQAGERAESSGSDVDQSRERTETRASEGDQTRERAESNASDAGERPRKRAESPASAEGERPRKRAESRDFNAGERPRTRPESRSFGGEERPRPRSQDAGDERRPRRGGDEDVETYRIEVGHDHGVKPGNIVGAIANEVGLEGRLIGRVVINEDHSFVDLPTGMPKEVFLQLQKVRVAGQPLQISRALKSHVEKLRRDRPSAPKIRSQSDSRRAPFKARGPRDSKPRR